MKVYELNLPITEDENDDITIWIGTNRKLLAKSKMFRDRGIREIEIDPSDPGVDLWIK